MKDLSSNKWKYKQKEAWLILQSGIYIFFINISEGTAFLPALTFGKRPRQPSDIWYSYVHAWVTGAARPWVDVYMHAPWFKYLATIYRALVVSA